MIALMMLLAACSGCVPGERPAHDETLFHVRANQKNTRESTVNISAYVGDQRYKGSGFYFLYKGSPVVITAAHVVEGTDSILVSKGSDIVVARIAYSDSESDLAVLSLPNLSDWKPANYKLSNRKAKIGDECYYSGFPNDREMMTLSGKVAGYTSGGDLILDSYAWSGASGSAVFNKSGRLVGIVSAIDVGPDYLGNPTIIQNVVMVVPVSKLDYNALDNALFGT